MDENTGKIQQAFEERIAEIKSSAELEQLRIDFLGKKGHVASLMGSLKSVAPEKKKEFGQTVNKLKQQIENSIQDKLEKIAKL